MSKYSLIQGDCLEVMKHLPSASIDLILCDLPYGTIKGLILDGSKYRTKDGTKWDIRIDTQQLFKEYERVLREKGRAILFSQEPYTSELRTAKYPNLEFAYSMIWKKQHFANSKIAKIAPVKYFEDLSVFYKKYDTNNKNPLRAYFVKVAEYIGFKSYKEINNKLGHRKAEHCFYAVGKNTIKNTDSMLRTGSTQFKLCTEDTYKELTDVFHLQEMEGYKTYKELQEINTKYTLVFNLPQGKNYIGDVLEFDKETDVRFHPTQKPIALLEYLIKTYSNEGDLVLDNCMGSGSTGVACLNTNRRFLGIELDENYFNIAKERIEENECTINT